MAASISQSLVLNPTLLSTKICTNSDLCCLLPFLQQRHEMFLEANEPKVHTNGTLVNDD